MERTDRKNDDNFVESLVYTTSFGTFCQIIFTSFIQLEHSWYKCLCLKKWIPANFPLSFILQVVSEPRSYHGWYQRMYWYVRYPLLPLLQGYKWLWKTCTLCCTTCYYSLHSWHDLVSNVYMYRVGYKKPSKFHVLSPNLTFQRALSFHFRFVYVMTLPHNNVNPVTIWWYQLREDLGVFYINPP